MEYHRSFYSQNISIKKYKTDYFETQDGELKLSIKKKGEILINNIFGVDVDREATEVAILSLYLKLLEHGIEDDQGWLFLKGKILPDMTMNIQYGNSLISREELFANDMFGNEKIRPFDWKNEVNGFGSIFNYSQGFDCVIGNPPYIKTQELQKSHPHLIELYKKIYTSGSTGNYDIYILFIEKALSLINRNGLIGFICPHKFFNSTYGMKIRELLSQKKALNKVLHFGVNQIFENATTYTCLLFLTGQPQEKFEYYEFRDEINDIEDALNSRISYFNIKSNVVDSSNWVFVNSEENNFLEKMRLNKPTLIDIATNIFQGPKAGADPVFIVKLLDVGKKNSLCYSSSIQNEFKIENSIIKPYVKGKYIRRYNIEKTTESIIFPYNKEGKLISEEELKADYPLAYKYLSDKENKRILLQREEGRFKNIWWSYSRPQNMQILDRLKILTPFNAFKSSFSLDSSGDFIFSAGVSGAYGILIRKDVPITYYYLLGILNSRLLDKFLKTISTALRGGFFSYENKYIRQLPIYIPTESEPKKYAQCKKIEEFVQ